MKIVYDYQSFCMDRFNGVSDYFANMIKRIKEKGVEAIFPFSYCDSIYMNELSDKRFFRTPTIIPQKVGKKIQMALGQYDCKSFLNKEEYDIVHSTQYIPYLFDYSKKPVVITIHDMTHEVFCINQPIIDCKKESVNRSDKIICISKNTLNDLIKFYPEAATKAQVIYHGYNESPVTGKGNHYGRYILYVGNRKGYKNFTRFLKCVTELLIADKSLNLVCTGAPFSEAEKKMMENSGITQQCISRYFSIPELGTLYENALCFVYPSLYEGFGLPILDAFHHMCPVCLSNTSCFPEIAGDAGAYFDPESEESMRETIENVISNELKRRELVEKGLERKKFFSWEKSAESHFEVYKSLL